jgi:hypothetical protein
MPVIVSSANGRRGAHRCDVKGAAKAWLHSVARVCPFLNHAADYSRLLPLIQTPPKLMNAAVHYPYRVGRIAGSVVAIKVMESRLWEKQATGAG